MNNDTAALAAALIDTARATVECRLNAGTSGNISARIGNGFIITPSGLPPAQCKADDMVTMTMEGRHTDALEPSSEWRIHRDIYTHFPGAGAIIHTHSPFATALACLRTDIPPFHYMIARFGGNSVRCATYAAFGSEELSKNALAALAGRNACLLANHGMLVYGRDLNHALAQAVELETLCEQYWRSRQIGPPALLTEAEMTKALERFNGYGRSRSSNK